MINNRGNAEIALPLLFNIKTIKISLSLSDPAGYRLPQEFANYQPMFIERPGQWAGRSAIKFTGFQGP